jgi:hypothetical protein
MENKWLFSACLKNNGISTVDGGGGLILKIEAKLFMLVHRTNFA